MADIVVRSQSLVFDTDLPNDSRILIERHDTSPTRFARRKGAIYVQVIDLIHIWDRKEYVKDVEDDSANKEPCKERYQRRWWLQNSCTYR